MYNSRADDRSQQRHDIHRHAGEQQGKNDSEDRQGRAEDDRDGLVKAPEFHERHDEYQCQRGQQHNEQVSE